MDGGPGSLERQASAEAGVSSGEDLRAAKHGWRIGARPSRWPDDWLFLWARPKCGWRQPEQGKG